MRSREAGTVAVLGATGCVGRSVRAAFIEAGRPVLAVARDRARRPDGGGCEPLDVATAAPREIAELLTAADVRVVVNATGGWLATEEANEHHHVRLVENLLEGTASMAAPPRIVQVGSIHEYGPVPPGTPIDESVEPKPVTPYARTKLAGSRALLDATRAGGAHAVVLRSVNVCGPGVAPASFLGTVVRRLREAGPGRAIELSVGDARRDFLDVRDLAAAVVQAADAPVVGRVINLGRGEAVSIRTMLALLLEGAGLPADAIEKREAKVESRGGDWTLADIRVAGEALGWSPTIGLRESMRDMWESSAAVRSFS
ncbi:NAD(P)-dependent oxidoreductase [Actinomadura sp. KC345]|uniref:NAD-dependent epimerase/dehydratase family protein n=1 Tax=Actinomadura sp. KC345 TaxID=2530371 RepID=UPI00105259CD|nr:NAD(P)-dependent oxidoreductase [Actinomadura sp. KC345]TDC45406.1 NAD(P)-dependent oxidoreductase [Actinomadura sp. KC345]